MFFELLCLYKINRVWDKSLALNIKSEQNELSDTQNSVLFAFLSNLSIFKIHNKEFLKSKSFYTSLAHRRLCSKNSKRDTVKVFKLIVKRKEKNMKQKAQGLSFTPFIEGESLVLT